MSPGEELKVRPERLMQLYERIESELYRYPAVVQSTCGARSLQLTENVADGLFAAACEPWWALAGGTDLTGGMRLEPTGA